MDTHSIRRCRACRGWKHVPEGMESLLAPACRCAATRVYMLDPETASLRCLSDEEVSILRIERARLADEIRTDY